MLRGVSAGFNWLGAVVGNVPVTPIAVHDRHLDVHATPLIDHIQVAHH